MSTSCEQLLFNFLLAYGVHFAGIGIARTGFGVTGCSTIGGENDMTCSVTDGRFPEDTPGLTETLECRMKKARDALGCCGAHGLLFSVKSIV